MWRALGRAFRRAAVPLFFYYAIALVVPLANGAASGSGFEEHALVLLTLPPVLVIIGCAVHGIAHIAYR
jgi:hypothetical protein